MVKIFTARAVARMRALTEFTSAAFKRSRIQQQEEFAQENGRVHQRPRVVDGQTWPESKVPCRLRR